MAIQNLRLIAWKLRHHGECARAQVLIFKTFSKTHSINKFVFFFRSFFSLNANTICWNSSRVWRISNGDCICTQGIFINNRYLQIGRAINLMNWISSPNRSSAVCLKIQFIRYLESVIGICKIEICCTHQDYSWNWLVLSHTLARFLHVIVVDICWF